MNKKIISLSLAFVMLLSMSTMAFADVLDLTNIVDSEKNYTWEEFMSDFDAFDYVAGNMKDYVIEAPNGSKYFAQQIQDALDNGAESFDDAIEGLEPYEETTETELKVVGVSAINANDETVTFSGTTTGAESVKIVVTNSGGAKVVEESVTVTDNTFSYKTKALAADTYSYSVSAVRGEEVSEATTGSVKVEAVRPTIVSVVATDSTHVAVKFSEPVNKTDAETVGNYSVRRISTSTPQTPTIAVLGGDKMTVTLTLGTALVPSPSGYAIAISNVKDANGNAIVANSEKIFDGVGTTDTVKPTIEGVSYDPTSKKLTLTMSEAVDTVNINKTGIAITDGATTIDLTVNETVSFADNNTKVIFTLSNTTATAVQALTTKNLNVAADAIKDTAGNGIEAVTGKAISGVIALQKAEYDEYTNVLKLTFDKVQVIASLDKTKITLNGNVSGPITLGATDTTITTANGNVVEIRLSTASQASFENANNTARTITLNPGAVTDLDGNQNTLTSAVTVDYGKDTTAPTLVSVKYYDALDKFVFEFSEKVKYDTAVKANITVLNAGTSLGTLSDATLQESANATTLSYSLTGALDVTIAEVEGVADKTKLAVAIAKNSVEDEAGNKLAEIKTTAPFAVTFVDATAPKIVDDATPIYGVNQTANDGIVAQGLNNRVSFAFNEKVKKDTAESVANYTIYKIDNADVKVNVQSASLAADGKTVTLITDAQVAGYTYVVVVTNVEDIYGNKILNTYTAGIDPATGAAGNVMVHNAFKFTAVAGTDTTAPQLASATVKDANSSGTLNAGDTITLTFNEAINVGTVVAADFVLAGGATPTLGTGATVAKGEGNNSVVITLGTNPAITFGTTTIDIKAGGTANIKDIAGNNAVNGAPQTLNSPDSTKPYITTALYSDTNASGAVDKGDTVILTFSEAIKFASGKSISDITSADFTFGGSMSFGTSPTFEMLGATQIRVTLDNGAVLDMDTALASRSTNIKSNTTDLVDLWLNPADNAGATAVKPTSEDATAPYIVSAVYTDNSNPADGLTAGDSVLVTYSEPIHLNGTITVDDFILSAGKLATTGTFTKPSANSIKITLDTGSNFTPGYTTINTSSVLNNIHVFDASGNRAVASTPVTITVGGSPDTTAPTVVSAESLDIDGDGVSDTIKVVFSESVLDSSFTPGGGAFACTDLTITDGTFKTVAGDVTNDNTIYLEVTAGFTGTEAATNKLTQTAGAITDLAGNPLAADATGKDISDKVAPVATLPGSTGDDNKAITLVVTFSEALYIGGTAVSNGADVKDSFTAAGGTLEITSALYDATAKTITFTLANAADTNTITHKADATKLTDAAGNAYPAKIYTYDGTNTKWASN
jgi:hypothetical protein